MSLEHSPVRILRRKSAARKLDVHVATLMRWATDARYAHLKFPKPIQIADGSTGFFEHEIDVWLETRPRIYSEEERDHAAMPSAKSETEQNTRRGDPLAFQNFSSAGVVK